MRPIGDGIGNGVAIEGAAWSEAESWLRAKDGEDADVSAAAKLDALLLEVGVLLWDEQVRRFQNWATS